MTGSVLITGAYGFIGRHAARRWSEAGWQVRGIGHGSWSREDWRSWGLDDWRATDVNLEALLTYAEEPDLIVHCAGSGSVGFSVAHPYQDFQRTVQTTMAVLEYLRSHAPQARMVMLSSAAVYGLAKELPIPESTPLLPVSPYGVHKRAAEDLCRSYARQFALAVSVVRYFSIYGPGLRKQLFWDACLKLSRGEHQFAGTGEERRDWLHVRDAVELLWIAAKHASAQAPVVNGGTGRSHTVRAALTQLARHFPGSSSPRFGGATRPGDPEGYEADMTAASAWGWSPSVELGTGIQEFADWFRTGAR